MGTVLFVPAASVTPKSRPLKPKLTVAILAVLCLALGAGWFFQHNAAVKERKFLEKKTAFLSNQWRQMSLELPKQKQHPGLLQPRLKANTTTQDQDAQSSGKALLAKKYIAAKEAYLLAFRGTTATSTSEAPARSANRFARMGLPATRGDAIASTMPGPRATITTTVRDEEKCAILDREWTEARSALLAAYAPPEIVAALARPGAMDGDVADIIAADPEEAERDLKVLLAANYIRAREAVLTGRYKVPNRASYTLPADAWTLEFKYKTGAKALISVVAPTTVLAAARNDERYALHAADIWAARLAPDAWKGSNARLAGTR